MGNINAAAIWTPDEDDNLDPEVWSAAMADSIMNGLGERMDKQEKKVSLRATAPEVFDVVSTGSSDPYTQVPLTIGGWTGSRAPESDFATGNHAEGITIDGDVATIVTPGLYNILGQISLTPGTFAEHSFDFYGTINGGIFGLPAYGATSALSFVGGMVSDTRYLAEGDNIALVVGVGTDHIGGLHVQNAMLTISMAYAT